MVQTFITYKSAGVYLEDLFDIEIFLLLGSDLIYAEKIGFITFTNRSDASLAFSAIRHFVYPV